MILCTGGLSCSDEGNSQPLPGLSKPGSGALVILSAETPTGYSAVYTDSNGFPVVNNSQEGVTPGSHLFHGCGPGELVVEFDGEGCVEASAVRDPDQVLAGCGTVVALTLHLPGDCGD